MNLVPKAAATIPKTIQNVSPKNLQHPALSEMRVKSVVNAEPRRR